MTKPLNPCLVGDGPEAAAVEVDPARIRDPEHPAREQAYRTQVRKALAAARYRDWLAEKRIRRDRG